MISKKRGWAFPFFVGLGSLAVVYLMRDILTPFLLALVITYVFGPAVDFLSVRGLPRLASILVLYALLGLVVVAAITLILPALVVELNRLGDALPGILYQIEEMIRSVHGGLSRIEVPGTVRGVMEDTIRRFQGVMLSVVSSAIDGLLGVLSALPVLVLSPVLAFYMLKDLERLKKAFVQLVPESVRPQAVSLATEIDRVVGGFVRGQLIVALMVGIMASIGLSLLGVRFSLLLGIFAGIGELIPYFGPVIGAIPAVFFALTDSLLLAAKVVVLFAVIQQIESSIISPRIVGPRVGLHPLVVIFALLAGGKLAGFWGLLVAVPGAAVIKVILNHILRRNTD